jgi:hypothetical protein
METVCEATVTVPVRASPEFTPTLSVIEPLPEPDPGATLIQLAPVVAFHRQPCRTSTVTDRWPPEASIGIRVGATP